MLAAQVQLGKLCRIHFWLRICMSAVKYIKGTCSQLVFLLLFVFFVSVAWRHTDTASAHGHGGTEPPWGDHETGTEYQRELAWGREEDG